MDGEKIVKKVMWYIRRLKAMEAGEIIWRLQQKMICRRERKRAVKNPQMVTEIRPGRYLGAVKPDVGAIPINWENETFTLFSGISLPGEYAYEDYKKQWHAGFQTEQSWPNHLISYDIRCSQRQDIGDIRTNWELNRHHQFVILAKSYYITGDRAYLRELTELFADWNTNNKFLYGPEWTSPMEIAIRINSWIFTYCFLQKGYEAEGVDPDTALLQQISQGILVMTEYVLKHGSRFSSANNHLIVEMYAVCLAGIFFHIEAWQVLAADSLTNEIQRQNWPDGVNKEVSLHYQAFIMEAYGLLIWVMKHNAITIDPVWITLLSRMSCFLADSVGEFGEVIEFGDNDEGKILDLAGARTDYYVYVLQLMSIVLPESYTSLDNPDETISWLAGERELAVSARKTLYLRKCYSCYRQGGYSFLRSEDRKLFIGIDHGGLGFGRIAAHGHNDALSFQFFVNGSPVFVDAGTYNYHITPHDRDVFRSAASHNTVMVNGIEPSEMCGPFLWGRRAAVSFLSGEQEKDLIRVQAQAEYGDIVHRRIVEFNLRNQLFITDYISGGSQPLDTGQIFLLHPSLDVRFAGGNEYKISEQGFSVCLEKETDAEFEEDRYEYSPAYNSKRKGTRIRCRKQGSGDVMIKTRITVINEVSYENS